MAVSAGAQCFPQMKGCALRVTSLNLNGTTLIGSDTMYATPALVSLGITPVYKDGTEISEVDACGVTFVDVKGDPSLTRYDIDLDVWSTDPQYLAIVIPDGDVLTGGSGEKGFSYPAPGTVTGQFSVEFWQQIINDNNLDPNFPYAHWAIPYLKNVQVGKRDVTGNGVSHTVLKAEAYVNTNWFNGPGNDWTVASTGPVMWIPTTTLPTMDCTTDAIAS